jgi:hypothetical protein
MLLVVEDEGFGEIDELDLQRFFLSHSGEERVPDIQEQPPACDRPPVPATEQLPGTSAETETHPAAHSAHSSLTGFGEIGDLHPERLFLSHSGIPMLLI